LAELINSEAFAARFVELNEESVKNLIARVNERYGDESSIYRHRINELADTSDSTVDIRSGVINYNSNADLSKISGI